MTKLKNRKGFTLVELIVVVAVLALLAVGAVMAIAGIQRNARITTNRNAANEMASAFNRHNAIAMGADAVSGDLPTGIQSIAWLHAPLAPDGDSVAISVGFSSVDRWDQVAGWVVWNADAMIYQVYADADFDVNAA